MNFKSEEANCGFIGFLSHGNLTKPSVKLGDMISKTFALIDAIKIFLFNRKKQASLFCQSISIHMWLFTNVISLCTSIGLLALFVTVYSTVKGSAGTKT